MRIVLSALLAVLLVACASSGEAADGPPQIINGGTLRSMEFNRARNLLQDELRRGMQPAEVRSRWGEPMSEEGEAGGASELGYERHGAAMRLSFEGEAGLQKVTILGGAGR